MKVESGFLFCNLWVNVSGNDEVMEWDKAKFGIDLEEIKAFWTMDGGNQNTEEMRQGTKFIDYEGDYYCVDIPFEKFSEIITKYRNSITIYN